MPLRQLFPVGASPAGDVKVDIIAVHGLNPRSKNDADHAWDTWRTPPGPGGRLWLREDLPGQVPDSRIFLYQYNATAVYGRDRDIFIGKANELLEAIRIERDEAECRPIIFLCHSLGGLLVKQALINAHNNPKYTPIKAATSGLAFFATPHNGGDRKLVSLGKIASKIATTAGFQKGDDVMEVLKSGSIFSDILQEHWRHQLLEYDIVSFWGGLDDVVPRESARLGLPGSRENVVKLSADHRGVCKFGPSETDQDNLKLVRGNIKDLYRSALKTGDPRRSVNGPVGRPRHYILPSLRNKNFTGRNAILDELQQKLFVRQECQKLAIVGLGGVGKTQVALQFAYWTKQHQPQYSVFWVPALSMASFTQAYLDIAKILGVRIDINEEDPKKSVQRHLSSDDAGRWLLIVDNADDKDVLFGSSEGAAGIHGYLPESDTGVTLFTTRFMEMGIAVATSDVLELRGMDAQEAEGFLRKSLIQKQLLQDEAITTTFLRELTYLPLAITQAAAYLNRNKMSLVRYLELLHGTEQDLMSLMSKEFQDNTRYRGSQNAVATTWFVSFKQIQESDAVAAELLSFISCIEPKAIPRSILPNPDSKEEMEFAIGTLSGYAFLVKREDDEVYDMHRLVQLATRIWIRKQERTEEITAKAIQHLDVIFPNTTNRADRQVWQAYFPHAFRLLDVSSLYPFEERSDLAWRVGDCLMADRRFREAIRYLEETRDWDVKHLAVTDPSRLSSEHSLASAYLSDGRIEDAIQILEHVVEVEKRTLGEEDYSRLASQYLLASAYLEDGRIEDAIQILEHVVEVDKRTLGEEDYSRLASQHVLASAYLSDERIEDAIQILEHVVEVGKRTLGEEDYSRLASQHVLASAYLSDGRVEDAIQILEHVVEVSKRTLGVEDYNHLTSEHNLARAYLQDGRIEEAIDIINHVVAVNRMTLAEDDRYRLISESLLTRALESANRSR